MGCSPPPAHTVDEAVLLLRVDAGEVAGTATAIPLRVLPGAPAGKVPVAVTLELVPVVVTALRVCVGDGHGEGNRSPSTPGRDAGNKLPIMEGAGLFHPRPSSPCLPPKGQGLGSVPVGVSPTPWQHTRGTHRVPTFLAAATAVAGQAEADEGVDFVDAGTTVLAGAGQAVIDVCRKRRELRVYGDPPPPPAQPTVPSATGDAGGDRARGNRAGFKSLSPIPLPASKRGRWSVPCRDAGPDPAPVRRDAPATHRSHSSPR